MQRSALRLGISFLAFLFMAYGCHRASPPAKTPEKQLERIEARAKTQNVPGVEQPKKTSSRWKFEGLGVWFSRWINGDDSNYAHHNVPSKPQASLADLHKKWELEQAITTNESQLALNGVNAREILLRVFLEGSKLKPLLVPGSMSLQCVFGALNGILKSAQMLSNATI